MATVRHTTLKGHKEEVVALYNVGESGCMISSSEDKTMRLWDVRMKNTSVRMFKIPDNGGDIGFCRYKNDLYTVSSGNALFGYDIRSTGSVIVSDPHWTFQVEDSDNEINDYAFSENSGLLAVPADSGRIHILSSSTFLELFSIEAHSNLASVVRFMPNDNNLISGGYDYYLDAWKVEGSGGSLRLDKRVPVRQLHPSESSSEDEEEGETTKKPPQIVNPAFVTCLNIFSDSYSPQILIGLGDGSLVVVDSKRGKPDFRQLLWGGSHVHATAVTAALWAQKGDSVWSIGNDRVLINMDHERIRVRMPLHARGSSMAVLDERRVAVGMEDADIRIYEFR